MREAQHNPRNEPGSSVIGPDRRKYRQVNRVGCDPKRQKERIKSFYRGFAFPGALLFTANSREIKSRPCACRSIPSPGSNLIGVIATVST